MNSTAEKPASPPPFVRVHGRRRLYDRFKQGVKLRSPAWFVRALQTLLAPYASAHLRALHRRRIREKLPEAIQQEALVMYAVARRRWNEGERAPMGPPMELPFGRSPHRVWLRPGTCDVILYDDIVVQEQYGSLPLEGVRTIVDAGANIGLASAYLLWKCPQARVVALEPDPVNYALCVKNLAAFGERAQLVHAGLWSRRCRIQVEPSTAGTWASTTTLAETGGANTIEAFDLPTLLDLYRIETLDLLKIDIEGAEREIFAAPSLAWLDRVGCIQIELEDEAGREIFFRALAGRGFELSRHREVTVAARRNWPR